jgi:hypothetical protein
MHHSDTHAPLIIRVAGLPAESMAPFSHPHLLDVLSERERLRGQLDSLRTSLVEFLHQAVHDAAREERRFFLAMKRRCFNGENLAAHRTDPRWPLLSNAAGTLVEAIVSREEVIAELEARLDELYGYAVRQEQKSIVQLSENRSFMRGVTLASPVVGQNIDRLKVREAAGYGRREKRLCLTLLRYASRAALKLSPFATLTRTAIARAAKDTSGFAFVPTGPWQERSTVCLHLDLLQQYFCLLLRCRRFTESLPVAVNETLLAEGDGRYCFFRPSRWVFVTESRSFRYEDASFVRVKLEGPLVSWLLMELRDGPRTWRHLLAGVQAELGDADSESPLTDSLTELIGIGLLNPMTPWDTSAPDLEERIQKHLDGLPGVELDAFREGLRRLTEFLQHYPKVNAPASFLDDAKHKVEGLFQALITPAALPHRIEFKAPHNTFEEGVFLLPDSDHPGVDEIVRFSWDQMRRVFEDLDPLVRLANLHSSHHDLLHALAAFGDRQWPNAVEVDFLEFFAGTQPLFEEWVRFRRAPNDKRPSAFNPLELKAVADLVRWRQLVDGEVAVRFDEPAQAQRLYPCALAALLDQVPMTYGGSRDFCAFVQPLDADARTWVVNAIGEGYGRFGGRFTAAMSPGMQERWASYFTKLSTIYFEGEEVELIDMPCPGGRTIDVHIPQTQRVLKMPGHYTNLPTERVLRLRDLRVRLRGADQFPVLADSAGQRLLPLQLGSAAARIRPTILKFLAAFGSRGFPPLLPMRAPRSEDGVSVVDRHWIGSTVYNRKRWLIELEPLLTQIDTGTRAFAEINSWRLAKGIPDRVFALERTAVFRRKPQYIDFSSPAFVQIFRSMLTSNTRSLALEEALPTPDQCLLHGDHWAAEVQLESFCFRDRPLSHS